MAVRRCGAGAAALALSACVASHGGHGPGPAQGASHAAVSDVPVRIGRPYVVKGVTYTPAANPHYDMLGLASWYGGESGGTTANGERFHPDAVSAAHTTLPLPSYVEVTAVDTGRVVVVRVNDRGPFAGSQRIIDLSRGAARQLGVLGRGVARVRVRAVEPSEADRRALREGRPAAPRPDASARVLANLRAQMAAAGM